MKTNIDITHKILKSSQQPLLHWKQSFEFIIKISIRSANTLKDVHDLVQKVIGKIFEYLKVLNIESQVSNNNRLVGIERMKVKLLAFVNEVTDPTNFQVAKIQELSSTDSIFRRASKKFQSKVARVEELTKMLDYWMIRAYNIIIPCVELDKVMDAMKAYIAKAMNLNKILCYDILYDICCLSSLSILFCSHFWHFANRHRLCNKL